MPQIDAASDGNVAEATQVSATPDGVSTHARSIVEHARGVMATAEELQSLVARFRFEHPAEAAHAAEASTDIAVTPRRPRTTAPDGEARSE